MAHLGGKSIRTVVTSLEVLSDDGKTVLMLDGSGDGVVIKTRKPHESTYGYDLPKWTVSKRDAGVIALVVNNSDAQYSRSQIDEITSSDFSGTDVDTNEVEKRVEERCSMLDIERARAANIAEENAIIAKQLVVQHMDDKHITRSITGCELCDEAISQSVWHGVQPGNLPYDPDDDSTKTPERGYGES